MAAFALQTTLILLAAYILGCLTGYGVRGFSDNRERDGAGSSRHQDKA